MLNRILLILMIFFSISSSQVRRVIVDSIYIKMKNPDTGVEGYGNITEYIKATVSAKDTAMLKTLNFTGNQVVFLRGLSSTNRNGSGFFVPVDSTYLENGGIAFDHPTAGKQWVRQEFLDKRIVNVKWFGAVGDGVTDDTQAIQDAINAAANGTVSFPEGTYMISGTLNLISNISLIAKNDQTVTLKAKSGITETSILKIEDISNISVKNLIFDANKTQTLASAPGLFCVEIYKNLNSVSGIKFENVKIMNAPFHGIYIHGGASNIQFKNCVFDSNGDASGGNGHAAGVYSNEQPSDLVFENCQFTNNFEHGYYCVAQENVRIINCIFKGNGGSGLTYRALDNGVIMGCQMIANGESGLMIQSTYGQVNNLSVVGNVIRKNQSVDREVSIEGINNLTFSQNIVGDETTILPRGILFTEVDSKNIIITDNIIFGDTYGILINKDTLNNVIIKGNTIKGSGTAIYIDRYSSSGTLSGDGIIIRDNIINGYSTGITLSANCAINNIQIFNNLFHSITGNEIVNNAIGSNYILQQKIRQKVVSVTTGDIPANSTVDISIAFDGAGYDGYAHATPQDTPPAGIIWCCKPAETSNRVLLRIANITSSTITSFTMDWLIKTHR